MILPIIAAAIVTVATVKVIKKRHHKAQIASATARIIQGLASH